jgi:hypothetical protein
MIKDKMTLMKMAKELNTTKANLKAIAESNNLKYTKGQKCKYYSLIEVKKALNDNSITILKPIYITQTYHIYESKMNYLNEL